MTIRAIWKKTAAILLVFTVLAVSFPTLMMQAAGEKSTLIADPSTMHEWQTVFDKDVLSTETAGAVWTDRSVFTDASAFEGTGVSLSDEEDRFLVALSAMASGISVNGSSVETVADELCFTDPLGEFMTVKGIKGILIGNTLFTGALLARNFVPDGGDLGSYDESTLLGDEMVRAIRARLGVDADTARSLIGLAYREGQLRYTSDTDFSNYIGWYANAAGEFLGFWYEGIETMPDPADPTLTDADRPVYIVRSYGYLGTTDEAHGVAPSDMMYTTVQVREEIQSGTETVLFYIPEELLPVVTYAVDLNQQGQFESLAVTGDEHPIRLVYEVAADATVDSLSVHDLIESGAVVPQEDGSVLFSTNDTGDSRFAPSEQNAYYRYTTDSAIFTDTNGTLYRGNKPTGDVYCAFDVYTADEGLVTKYARVSPQALACAQSRNDGTWYIPANTMRADTSQGESVCESHDNKGSLTLIPETGIVLRNIAKDADRNEKFDFVLTRTDGAETGSYKARLRTADGKMYDQRVLFENGVAVVTLLPDETLFVYGMAAEACYSVAQKSHENYKVIAVNGDTSRETAELTTKNRRVFRVSFENSRKGYGGVTIVKRILHDFGTSYEIPDKRFSVLVTLSEDYALQTLQVEHTGDPTVTTVTTDETASFVVELGHGDQLELLRLKEGTVVTAEEFDIPDGFVPLYYGAGIKDASSVTVQANTAVSLLILNRYTYEEVDEIRISVSGVCELIGRDNGNWLDTDVFVFDLQRYENGSWIAVASQTATKDVPYFDFTQAMETERFAQSGVYSYRVIERIGDLAGIVYDHTAHTFSVIVGDEGMCGHLHILDVVSHHDHTHVDDTNEQGWHIHADFTNTYHEGGYAEAVMDIRNILINPSGSDRVSLADQRYALYVGEETLPHFVSDYTDMIGETRLIASFDQSGEYVYSLRAIVPETPLSGMVYSDEVYRVTVTVTEDAVGALSANVSIVKDDESVDIPCFTNRYAPQTAVMMPAVKAELTGRELNDGEFAVHIHEGDTLLAVGYNDIDGNIVFEHGLEFTAVGDYYYDVTEVNGSLGGVTYDPIVYRLHISVSDGGDGALVAHYHVINTAVDVITFRNIYEATAVQVVIGGVKELVGRELINEEFAFVLVEVDNPRGMILSASNYADGTFRFAPITVGREGVYRYSVHEVFESVAHGIVFDDSVYEVTLTVEDNGNGELNAQTAVCKDGQVIEQILFVNEYVTKPAEVTLRGRVLVDGMAPADGQYSVELYEADEQWQSKQPIATVQNDENGDFVLPTLSFDTEGVYTYLVKQSHGGEVYRVRIDVTDNRRGTIFAQVTLCHSDNSVAKELLFENTAIPDTTVTTTTSAGGAGTTVPSTTTTARKDNPPTGDLSDLALWFALLFAGGGVSMTLAVRGKKEYGE